jgi:hypothetical protein
MRRAVLLITTIALIAMPLGHAGAASQTDPNDSDGQQDIRLTALHYNDSTGTMTLRLKTQQVWGCKFLRQGIKTSLNWYVDDGEDGDNDLTGKFVCVTPNKNPKLIFKLQGNDSGNNYEALKATRPNHRTVVVKMPTDLTEFESDHASVHARSSDAITEGCDPACTDRAPDTGGMRIY